MIYLQRTGVGTVSSEGATNKVIYDSSGTGMLPVQAKVTGTATYRVTARVDPAAPWLEVIPPATVDSIQSLAWVPYLQLEITSGAGTVEMWIGEK